MTTLSPLEEFVRDSHELKSNILDQALKENALLREQVAELRLQLELREALLDAATMRLEHANKLVNAMLAPKGPTH